MACAPGCTDCPACRGEVPHDAPVMHDLAWGLLHVRATAWPNAWDLLRTGQVVVGGGREREARDRQGPPALTGLEPSVHEIAGPRWPSIATRRPAHLAPHAQSGALGSHPQGGSSAAFDDCGRANAAAASRVRVASELQPTPLPPVPGADGLPREMARRVAEAIVAGRVRTYLHPERNTVQPKRRPPVILPWIEEALRGTPWDPPLVWAPKCCVDEFVFPDRLHMEPSWDRVATPFDATGKFSNVAPCSCDCCFFMQLVEEVAWEETFPGDARGDFRMPPESLHEDCDVHGGCSSGTWLQSDFLWQTVSQCMWTFSDSPTTPAIPPVVLNDVTEYVGLIFDTCNDWVVVAWDAFETKVRVAIRPREEQQGRWVDSGSDGDRVARPLANPYKKK